MMFRSIRPRRCLQTVLVSDFSSKLRLQQQEREKKFILILFLQADGCGTDARTRNAAVDGKSSARFSDL